MTERQSFRERARAATVELALRVALDPSESAADVAAARQAIASGDAIDLSSLPMGLIVDLRRVVRAVAEHQSRRDHGRDGARDEGTADPRQDPALGEGTGDPSE